MRLGVEEGMTFQLNALRRLLAQVEAGEGNSWP